MAPLSGLIREPQLLVRVGVLVGGCAWLLFGPGTVTLSFAALAAVALSASIACVVARAWRGGPLRIVDLPAAVGVLDLLTGGIWTAANSSVMTSTAYITVIVASVSAIGRLGGPGAVGTVATWIAGRGAAEILRRMDGRPTEPAFIVGEGALVLSASVALWVTFAAFQRERVRTVALLAQVERELGLRRDYVSLVAHEMRNPLAGIKAAATVLARGNTDPAVNGTAVGIAAEASACLALFDDLAEVSSVESGRLRSAMTRIDLDEVVRRTIATFDRVSAIQVISAGTPLPVLGDERRSAQIVRNLVSNAIKYSPVGSPVEITIGLSGSRRSASVGARDLGPGVPPDERPRLFEKFQRLSTAGGTRGSGLGLYISREIVRDHGGELVADWPSGGGSIFTFSIPLAD